ncbi:hypothetical protein BKP64_04600 [Marinobacter salinus]|uniref:Polysaccharide biosynthesis protein n=1 Tax=Marinobacter salinus TaxID=1874317 RepID=A0A1D9GIN9_9GAMM|nr:oligosaccharide flippase family protein [Marinobacter salinus]AOY87508.1 hypothetical protein BKP64_04600 [Marinobacter salinus]
MPNVRRAIIFSSLTGYSLQILGLVSTMAVARLLSPEEIGTFAVASAIVMVIGEFRVLGAGAYLVREKELTVEKVRSALGLTMMISWGLGAGIFLSAPLVANFYELAPIVPIFGILSISFLLAPFISLPFSIYAREMNFDVLFKVQLAGALANLAVTISLILMGFSFFALAWGYTLGIITQFVMFSLFYSPESMRYVPHFKNLREIASFGVFNSTSNLLRKALTIAPDLVIGKLGNTHQVGIFSRGLGFMIFIFQSLATGVSPIALPYLSGTRREGGDLAYAFLRASVLLGGMVVPVLAVGSLVSLSAIRIFFGDQWDAAAPIATWLALWVAIRSVFFFSYDLFLAAGIEREMVVRDAVVLGSAIVCILISFPYGLERVAQALIISGLVEAVVTTWMLKKYIHLSVGRLVKAWLPNIFIASGCTLATVFIKDFLNFDEQPALVSILYMALFMPPIWLILLAVFRHPLLPELRKIIPIMRPGR